METQKDKNNVPDKVVDNKENFPFIYSVLKQEYIICEVCGCKNPEKTAICKNCSNYIDKNF